jgi:Xaa-Pro aminopeptidase
MHGFAQRIDGARKALAESNIDALVLVDPSNIFYLTGVRFNFQSMDIQIGVWQSVIVSKENCWLIVYEKAKSLAEKVTGVEIKEYSSHNGAFSSIASVLAAAHSVGVEHTLPMFLCQEMQRVLPSLRIVEGGDIIARMRMKKTDDELALLKRAERIAMSGMSAAVEAVRPGARETEIAAAADRTMWEEGAQDLAFATKVASGRRAGTLSSLATKRKISSNDAVIVDLGCVYRGYSSDLTRTVCVGRLSKPLQVAREAVVQTRRELLHELKAGASLASLGEQVTRAFSSRGLNFALYHPSHGIGIDVVEPPTLSRYQDEPLGSGTALMLEFSINLPEKGGYGFEDLLFFTSSGVQLVSKFPME